MTRTPMYPKPPAATTHVAGAHVQVGDVVFLEQDLDGQRALDLACYNRNTVTVSFGRQSATLNRWDHVWIAR